MRCDEMATLWEQDAVWFGPELSADAPGKEPSDNSEVSEHGSDAER